MKTRERKLLCFTNSRADDKIQIVAAGYGSVWLERTAGGREVAGSNPVTPIFINFIA